MPDDSHGMLLGEQSARVETLVQASVSGLRSEIVDDRRIPTEGDRRTIQSVAARTLQTIHVIDDLVDGLRERLLSRADALEVRTDALKERIEQLGTAPEAPTEYDAAHGPAYGRTVAVLACGAAVGATVGFARLLGLSWGVGAVAGAIAIAFGLGGLFATRGLGIRERGRLGVLAVAAIVAAVLMAALIDDAHTTMERLGGALLAGAATAIIFGISDGVIRGGPRRDFRVRERAWANAVAAAKSELDITIPQETAEIDGLVRDLDELEVNYFGKAREYFTHAVNQVAGDGPDDRELIAEKYREIDDAIKTNVPQKDVA